MHQIQAQNEEIDINFNYYHEYCRLHMANVVLTSQMRELINQRNQLSSKFSKLEKITSEIFEGEKSQESRPKRFRRTADSIQRHYRCPVKICQKSYGSEGSLNQHIKIKHPQIYTQQSEIKEHRKCPKRHKTNNYSSRSDESEGFSSINK